MQLISTDFLLILNIIHDNEKPIEFLDIPVHSKIAVFILQYYFYHQNKGLM